MARIKEKLEELDMNTICSTRYKSSLPSDDMMSIISNYTGEEYLISIDRDEIVTIIYSCGVCGKFEGFNKLCKECTIQQKFREETGIAETYIFNPNPHRPFQRPFQRFLQDRRYNTDWCFVGIRRGRGENENEN